MILNADCIEAMAEMDADSIDAIVCDPPYGLGFMGKEWDEARRMASVPPSGTPDTPLGRFNTGKGPAAVAFDGHAFQSWSHRWATEALRILKPGAHLLAFGGTRTYHRLACAIEDAGFEIRDSLIWIYGSGFPKSLDVSKAIDKAAGAERTERPDPRWAERYPNGPKGNTGEGAAFDGTGLGRRDQPITTSDPATPEAQQWQGWGTALKPSHEPVVVARKPLAGTVASNVLQFGTGALNIDACRVGVSGQRPTMGAWASDESLCDSCAVAAARNPRPGTPETRGSTAPSGAEPITSERGESGPGATSRTATGCSPGPSPEAPSAGPSDGPSSSTDGSGRTPTDQSPKGTRSTTSTRTEPTTDSKTCASCGLPITGASTTGSPISTQTEQPEPTTTANGGAGRWPSNCILSEQAAAELDQQSGELVSGANPTRRGSDKFRNAYGDFEGQRECEPARGVDTGGASRFFYCAKASSAERNAGLRGFDPQFAPTMGNGIGVKEHDPDTATPKANVHPTVKPIDLMRWLVRLVTPPDGTVLDPFTGSGTTGAAAALEGFDFIGIEREAEYAAIAEARVKFWAQFPGADVDAVLASDARAREIEAAGQGSLLEEAA